MQCNIRVLIFLISSGVSSALERSLLAATQQRQSPSIATFFGISNFILDGIKLFSKTVNTPNNIFMAVVAIGFLFVIPMVVDVIFGKVLNGILFLSLPLTAWSILGVIELTFYFSTTAQQNHFVQLATLRALEIIIATELSFGLLLLILIAANLIVPTTAVGISALASCLSVMSLGIF